VNKFLRHHLEKTKVQNIDIEFDHLAISLSGSPFKVDTMHDTCVITPNMLPQLEPLFIWGYLTQMFALDGTKNAGKLYFRTTAW